MTIGLTSNIVGGENTPIKGNDEKTSTVILETMVEELSDQLTDNSIKDTIKGIDPSELAKEVAAEEKDKQSTTKEVAAAVPQTVAQDITEKAKIEAQKLVDAAAKTNSAIAEIKPKLLTIIWQKIGKVALDLGMKIGTGAVVGLLDGSSLTDSIFNASKKVFTEEITNLSGNK